MLRFVLAIALMLLSLSNSYAGFENIKTTSLTGFTENKGQMSDREGRPVDNIWYKLQAQQSDVYLTSQGLTYIFYKLADGEEEREREEKEEQKKSREGRIFDSDRQTKVFEWCRVDVELIGANLQKHNLIQTDTVEQGFNNYYYPHCPNGVLGVYSYRRIKIKDVYPGIDWLVYLTKEGQMKYDFVVHPGADPGHIQMEYKGAKRMQLKEKGSVLSLQTPFGKFREGRLYCYQNIHGKEVPVGAQYQLKSQQATFKFSNYNHTQPLIIDPPLETIWATLYGADSHDGFTDIAVDDNGEIYISGYAWSTNFLTQTPPAGGYFQGTLAGGQDDAIAVKFNKNGVRVWATYYGGTNPPYPPNTTYPPTDEAHACAVDKLGNFYMGGFTGSPDFPLKSKAGAFNQATYGGGNTGNFPGGDCFIVKFKTANGALDWGTLMGGNSNEYGTCMDVDANNNVYFGGYAQSTNFPTKNPGGGAYFQGSNLAAPGTNGFIAKFNPANAMVWCTFMPSTSGAEVFGIELDMANNVIVVGSSSANDLPITKPLPASYSQDTLSMISVPGWWNNDGFIAKFTATGAMYWCTYFGGGKFDDKLFNVTTDATGNIYVSGETGSDNFLTQSAGGATYFQAAMKGPFDAVLAKFTPTGILMWSTYLGGSGEDRPAYRKMGMEVDALGNFYHSGQTTSTDFPVKDAGGGTYFNGTYGGSPTYAIGDAYIFSLNKNDEQQWGTYYGGGDGDWGGRMAIDKDNCLYVIGEVKGPGAMTFDPGGGAYYQPQYNNALNKKDDDSFIIKFCPTSAMKIDAEATNTLCHNDSSGTLSVKVTGGTPGFTYLWHPGGYTDSVVTGVPPGTYTVTVSDAGGLVKKDSVIIEAPDELLAVAPPDVSLCSGDSVQLNATATGGTPGYTYLWGSTATKNIWASPVADTAYILTVTDTNGCTNKDTVTIKMVPFITAAAGPNSSICIGDSVQLLASGGSAYSWSPATGLSSANIANPMATPKNTTTYTVTVSSGGCPPQTATVTITVVPSISSSLSSDTIICVGDSVTLTVSGGSTYSWSPSAGLSSTTAATVVATPTATTTYSVTVTSGACAPDTNSVTIKVAPKPTVTIGSDTSIMKGETISFSLTGPGTYSWHPPDGLSCFICPNPIASPTATTTYEVTYLDTSGCIVKESITINVEVLCENKKPEDLFFLPNAFTPNNDGNNDELYVRLPYPACVKSLHLKIYDRWGELVFESFDAISGWDGNFNGKPMDAAAYDYFLELTGQEGNILSLKGSLHLIR